MVVSRMANSDNYQGDLESEVQAAGVDVSEVYFAQALKCRTFDANASNLDVKKCRPYLEEEIKLTQCKWILALGNEALLATTGHSGITKYRGRIITRPDGVKVIPTISMAAVNRNPGQKLAWQADLNFFAAAVNGLQTKVNLPKIAIIDSRDKLRTLRRLIEKADLLSYDLETTMGQETADGAAIVSMAGTMFIGERQMVWALPLHHPGSPWPWSWQKALRFLGPALESVPKQIAHNGKFDARWLRHFGVRAKVTFDTMVAAHLLDENRPKGLKPLSRILLGVPPWAIDTKSLLETPLNEVLKYNALDTFYTYEIYKIFRKQLAEQPRLARLFLKMLMPANDVFIDVERRGVWIDREKLANATKISFDMREEIDRKLTSLLPPEEEWPTNARGRKLDVNFNTSNFARWFIFGHLGMPVIERGKEKPDGSPGDPSMKEAVMLELKKYKEPAIELLLERTKWQKYCSNYVTRYEELADDNDRIHTSFRLTGTVTGRLSSGKEDADKITGRTRERGVNLQQVPRDPFIRGLFGAPPGWTFVEADFSQVELRVVAFLSRDRTMLHLYQTGQDIHRATAAWVMGKPASQVSKDDRKKAKAVNFGFVYGMGARKFVATAFEKYELVFTESEAKDIRRLFFEQFSGLMPWHARQRRLAHQYARVQSPLGRVRNLPDIRSADSNVVAEAERQAINSPVQSFASDMTLISMVLIQRKFERQGIQAHVLGTVHDAINFEVADEDLGRALPIIKRTMENLPLRKMFGVNLDVPIIADLKVGSHWGDARELSEEEVYSWPK
jgi:DNA polymerase-1